jgi:3-hydroxy-D-aspartate aldolase
MANEAPAHPGMALREVDTPALIIDLDGFERNLRRMSDAVAKAGVRLRPHAKTHKSPIIAHQQIALGAVGICCQKVSEAEIMVRDGIGDVLVSNEIAGAAKLHRLAALARHARIAVCVDDIENVAELADAAQRSDVRLSVLVEIDVGAKRCGVAAGEPALRIASAIARSNSLHFGGLQAYHGSAQHLRSHGERRDAIARATDLTRGTVDLFSRDGLACEIVGGAGTGTFELEAASGVYNELQAGSYIFMDADYGRNRKSDGSAFDTFDNALFVLTTVMSRPNDERAVVDAGHKSAAVDSGLPEPFGLPGVVYRRPSDEHGVLVSEGGRLPQRGDKVLLVPGHCDPTVNLHEWYVCVRGLHGAAPHVEAIWPISARGAVF